MRKLNDLFQELGISKVRLAKYLGVSRQMVYNYLELEDLNKWPKEKKILLYKLLDIEDSKEIETIDVSTEYLMNVENRLNQGVKSSSELENGLDLKGLNKESQVLLSDITYLLNKLDKSDLSSRVIECLIDYFIMLNQEYGLTNIAKGEDFDLYNNNMIYVGTYIKTLKSLSTKPLLQIPIIVFSTINKYKTFYYKPYFVEMTKYEATKFFTDRKNSLSNLKNEKLFQKELKSEGFNLPDYENLIVNQYHDRLEHYYDDLDTTYYENLKKKALQKEHSSILNKK